MSASDCLVVGAGPAGTLAATLLHEHGWSVTLVGTPRRRHVITHETMLPGAKRCIEQLELAGLFAEFDFFGCARQEILWGGPEIETSEPALAQRGFRVDRDRLDEALRRRAVETGVRVLDHHTVVGDLPRSGVGPVDVAGDGVRERVTTQAIVLATGRTAHGSMHTIEEGPATTALVFSGAVQPMLDDTTRIEAIEQGWAWWLPATTDRCSVALFFDSDELRTRGSKDLIADALANVQGPRPVAPRPSQGVDCTARLMVPDHSVYACGDAASAIDPLSSQGLEKAFASADSLACAVDTALRQPDLAKAALDWHRAWERRLWLGHRREAAAWYARERRFEDAPFWRNRQPDPADASRPLAPTQRLRVASRLERRTALRRQGGTLAPAVGYGLRGDSTTWTAIGTLSIQPLIDLLDRPTTLAELVTKAGHDPHLFPLGPRAVAQAFEALEREGFVEADSTC